MTAGTFVGAVELGPLANTDIIVESALKGRALRDFIRLPADLYKDDPNWIPPIPFERKFYFSRRNPVFREKAIGLWTAYRAHRPVGRISAQINPAAAATGYFGCLESEDDPAVFEALCQAAENWLGQRGAEKMVGPFSLSINDECGLLVDGFDTPPMVMMPHGRRYYEDRCLQTGFVRETDLLAYLFDLDKAFSPLAERIVRRAAQNHKITLRSIRPADIGRHIGPIIEIFNDGWSNNWGFEAISSGAGEFQARQMKHLLTEGMIWIADVDGMPAAMAISIPNVNEALVPLRNGLSPRGLLAFANVLLRKKFTTARIPLMGVKKQFHGTAAGAELALSLISATRDSLRGLGIGMLEISWILPDNTPTRHIVEDMFGADLYKTYRIFSRPVGSERRSGTAP